MKELIKEAEELYNQLNGIPMEIFSNRTNKDPYGVNYYIREMGDLTCKMLAFLKKLIDRKDNIIDLGEVWHSVDIEPQKGSWFVGQIGDNAYDTFIAEIEGKRMKDWFEGCNIKRWAYIKDLFPKGGEK